MNLYTDIVRPGLFRFHAETAHHIALTGLKLTPAPLVRALFGGAAEHPVRLFGLTFPNPVGLAAGMDKNAEVLGAWEALGFGFVEAGTVTALAQPGNDKPRCFRYPRQHALINRMGFNNLGAEAVARNLAGLKASGRWPRIPVGMNIGKSKVTALEDAPSDYAASFRRLAFGLDEREPPDSHAGAGQPGFSRHGHDGHDPAVAARRRSRGPGGR